MEEIINRGNGTPRIIDKICDISLKIKSMKKAKPIAPEIVMMAVDQMELG